MRTRGIAGEGVTAVLGDELRPRVFSNRFHNAIERNDAETPRVRVSAEKRRERIVLEIADDGPGISPETQPGLFERTGSSGSSHGLWLSLVGTLVDRYGSPSNWPKPGPMEALSASNPREHRGADETGEGDDGGTGETAADGDGR